MGRRRWEEGGIGRAANERTQAASFAVSGACGNERRGPRVAHAKMIKIEKKSSEPDFAMAPVGGMTATSKVEEVSWAATAGTSGTRADTPRHCGRHSAVVMPQRGPPNARHPSKRVWPRDAYGRSMHHSGGIALSAGTRALPFAVAQASAPTHSPRSRRATHGVANRNGTWSN